MSDFKMKITVQNEKRPSLPTTVSSGFIVTSRKQKSKIQVVRLRQQLVKLRWVLNPLRSLHLLHSYMHSFYLSQTSQWYNNIICIPRRSRKMEQLFFFSFILMCRTIIYRALLNYSHNHTDQQQGGWERLVPCTPQLEKKFKKRPKIIQ